MSLQALIHSPAAVSAAYSDALSSLRRYARIVHGLYQEADQADPAAAGAAHAKMLYVETAVAALRASNKDEGAREVLRALAGARQ